MLLDQTEIKALERIKRLNIINSVTGIKPANLIGTYDKNKQSNLAIFSSVVHLGSDPAVLGFITRPSEEIPRNTLNNIIQTEHYTINHVPTSMAQKAHQTSAKYPADQSEFEICGFDEMLLNDFPAPFVKGAPVQIGLKLSQTIPIEINQTQMVVGEIKLLKIADELISPEGYIDLEKAQSAGISGLNSYYQLKLMQSYPYARV